MDSTLLLCYAQRTVSTMEWALLLMHSTLLCTIGLHPTLCATPYNYFLQRSPFEWAPPYPVLFSGLRPSTLYCTLPPPPPVLLIANNVSHGLDPLINGLHPRSCTIEWNPPYPLQRTKSAMKWTRILVDSILPCAGLTATP